MKHFERPFDDDERRAIRSVLHGLAEAVHYAAYFEPGRDLVPRPASLERGQAAILNVVTSIDERLKQWKDIPERVERLEKAVFPT